MSIMEYAEASDWYGPRPVRDNSTVDALAAMIQEACDLLFLIDHPRYKDVYAEVDPHINMPVYPGVNIKSFGFLLLEGDELIVLQHKVSHWYRDRVRSRVIINSSHETRQKLVELFKARVTLMMGITPPHPKRDKNME